MVASTSIAMFNSINSFRQLGPASCCPHVINEWPDAVIFISGNRKRSLGIKKTFTYCYNNRAYRSASVMPEKCEFGLQILTSFSMEEGSLGTVVAPPELAQFSMSFEISRFMRKAHA